MEQGIKSKTTKGKNKMHLNNFLYRAFAILQTTISSVKLGFTRLNLTATTYSDGFIYFKTITP